MSNNTTFVIEITHNTNNSWQGNIEWVQEGKKEYFRSTMELLELMQSAVGAGEDDE